MRKSLLIGLLMLGVGGVAQAQERLSAWDLFCRGGSTGDVRVVVTFEDDTRKVITNSCTPGTRALEEWKAIPASRGNIAHVKVVLDAANEQGETNHCTYTTEVPFTEGLRCKAQYNTGDQVELFFSIPPVP
jgi:hypothetical protein